MISLNKYKENKLLTYGTSFFTCSYIILFAYAFLIAQNTNETTNEITIIPLLFGIIIAPLLEELIFRGIFVKRKIFIWLYIGGVIYYIIALKSIITIPVFIIHLRILFLQRDNNIQAHTSLSYYLNAFIFSLIHYNISDGFDFISIMQIGIRFGIGLMLIWLVINFNLITSIIAHSFYNFFIFSLQLIAYQAGSLDAVKTAHTDNYKIEWNKPQGFFSLEKITFNKDTLTMQNQTFDNFLIYNGINTDNIDSIQLAPSFSTSKYNIILIKKDSLVSNLEEKQIIELLLKAKILNKKQ